MSSTLKVGIHQVRPGTGRVVGKYIAPEERRIQLVQSEESGQYGINNMIIQVVSVGELSDAYMKVKEGDVIVFKNGTMIPLDAEAHSQVEAFGVIVDQAQILAVLDIDLEKQNSSNFKFS